MVRLGELMDNYKGKLCVSIAKKIIADHHDVYLNRQNPCSRTVCSHYELDAREYMSQADRPKPFSPHGALDGCVVDGAMARQLRFWGRYGNSCGMPFNRDKFCNEHRQWEIFRPYLMSRPRQPWIIVGPTTPTPTTRRHPRRHTRRHGIHATTKHRHTRRRHNKQRQQHKTSPN
jgi:hypothetical protein